MKTYELTYIIPSSITLEETTGVTKEIETFIKSNEGVVLHSEKTNAQMLSYPMKKQNSGYFAILTFQTTEDKIKAIKGTLEKNSNVLRHLLLVKNPPKIMKERRSKKPLFKSEVETKESVSPFKNEAHVTEKKEEAVNIVDIDKKLDELLGE